MGDEGDDEVGGCIAEDDTRGGIGCDALQLQREFAAFGSVLIVEDDKAAADVGEDGPADVKEIEMVSTEGTVTAEVLHVEQQSKLGVAAAQPGGVAGGDVPQRLVAGEVGAGATGCTLADDGEGVWKGE